MVYYRKYRPQTIDELDTASIRQSLGAVLSSGKIPHAFLFTGPRGLGKTSAARIVAKSINCVKITEKLKNKKTKEQFFGEPCNKCVACVSITNGTNLDVLELDAASNRGIDEIRDLREKIKLAPTSLQYKVYIIDEVHMLTTEAFNALLKTLEEPPSHAIFILCTTEVHKLPATIISRCLRFDFKRAAKEDLVRSLERIVKGEKLKIGNYVLEEIARGSDGSFREAAKILEQASFSGGEITEERIKEILGETQNLKPERLLELLAKKDARGAVSEINRIVEAGENLRVYNEKILALFHNLLMVRMGVEEEEGDLGNVFEKGDLIKLIELFSTAYGELKTAVIPQLPLELAAVEYCEITPDALSSGVDSDKFSNGVPTSGSIARGPVGLHPHPTSSSGFAGDAGARWGSPASATPRSSSTASPIARNEIDKLWPKIIEATKEFNHTLAGVLRGCRPQNFDGKILTIETLYQFHKDKLNEPRVREFLDKAVAKVLGENIGLKCVLREKEKVIK